jgi:hypothetical protein
MSTGVNNTPPVNVSFIQRTPTSLVNAFSANGFPCQTFNGILNGKNFLSGAMVANTLKAVLSLAGPGVLNFFGALTADATNRTMRIQIVLDGVTVYDFTSAATAASGVGAIPVGAYLPALGAIGFPDFIPFKTSCVVNMASSLGETDKFQIYEMHRMT